MTGAHGLRVELMLLVDGELDGQQAAQVARRCRDDPAMGAAVAALETDRALIRAAFPPAGGGDESAHGRIDAALDARRRRQRWAQIWHAAAPLLASILTATVLGAGAVALAERRAAQAASFVLAEQARDRQLMAATFKAALDTQVSGGSVVWQNPASGSRGSVTPLRTFKAADGRWCREYRQEVEGAAMSERRIGIACRDAGGWRLRLERPAEA
jgi:anti-sigma factor RsiW